MNRLIEKFWSGSASLQERKRLLAHILEEEKQEKLVDDFYTQYEDGEKGITNERLAQVLNNVHAEIRTKKLDQPTSNSNFSFRLYPRWMVAAILFIAIGSAFYFNSRKGLQNHESVASKPHVSKAVEWVSIKSQKHDRVITLPDGSVAMIRPNSNLSYQQQFGRNTRNITLNSGEALFKVMKNPAIPFKVTANGITTTAIGTEFIVNRNAKNVNVRLLEGKIVIKSDKNAPIQVNETYLVPGEQFSVNYITGKTALSVYIHPKVIVKALPIKKADLANLSYKRESLDGVFKTLSRHYNISIEYDGEIMNGLSFTGEFKTTDSLEFVLNTICSINNLTYRDDDHKITIINNK